MTTVPTRALGHLDRLEAESIHILRETVAETERPVMLYSIGKDSAAMLHLALKAFYPSKPPFPLLHVNTMWKFKEMIAFRDKTIKQLGLDMLEYINPQGIDMKISPFDHGSKLHTQIMKTEALKQALDKWKFDAAFGGARRDEEKSRAKERVLSFRTAQHRCVFFQCLIGPKQTCGIISRVKTSQSCRFILLKNALLSAATAL